MSYRIDSTVRTLTPPRILLLDWHATLVDSLDAMYRAIDDLLPQFEDDGHRILPADSSDGSVEEIVERRELLGHVRRCIDQLPETYRTVLLLRDVEELDTAEAAIVLGISANAVKIRLHRAHQALCTLLQKSRVEWGRESAGKAMSDDSSAVA